MDSAALIGIGGFIGLCIFFWIYYWAKEKLKRNVFFKGQYEEQKQLTHQNMIITTNASKDRIFESLNNEIKIDDSVKGAFKGGIYKCTKKTDNYIEYLHTSSIYTGGEGDEFSSSVLLKEENEKIKAIVSINRWREKDGVTRKAGIEAMKEFYSSVERAFKNIDSNAKVEYVNKN